MKYLDNFNKNLKRVFKKTFRILVVTIFIFTLINYFLLLRLSFLFESQTSPTDPQFKGTQISQSQPALQPEDQEKDRDSEFSRHIERLIILNHLFNNEESDEDIDIAELIIINDLFSSKD